MNTEFIYDNIIHGFTADALPCMRVTDHAAVIFVYDKLGYERIIIQRAERNSKGDIETSTDQGWILMNGINKNLPTTIDKRFVDLQKYIKCAVSATFNEVNLIQRLANEIMDQMETLVRFNKEKLGKQNVMLLTPSSEEQAYNEVVWRNAYKNFLIFAGRCIACLEATYIGDTVPACSVIKNFTGSYDFVNKTFRPHVSKERALYTQNEDISKKIIFENYIWDAYRG